VRRAADASRPRVRSWCLTGTATALLVGLAAATASAAAAAGSGVKAPPTAEKPATWTGTASGEMTAQGTKTPLRHAYAVVVRPRNAAADETRVVLSEEPVPLEVLEELPRRLPSFELRGVEVVLEAGGGASAVFFHHDEVPAGLEVREVAKVVPAVIFDDAGFSFGLDATFDAPLFRPAARPSRAADQNFPSEERAKASLGARGLELTPGAFDRVVGAGDVEAVRLFLAAGADPNGEGYAGTPLLAVAAERQGADVVRALVEGGADVTRKGAGNATALFAAAADGRLDSVDVLLASGAKVTARTSYGWTALHWAAQRGDLPMVKRLIAAGADVSRDGKELLDLARSAKSREVEKAIREAPATPRR